ncbi:mitochondrion organization and biogenesis [Pyrenophora seminiperda CCB06]|uniref:Required for respiratory growth protein 9, mitochondrial n=1 Tax=Pyrenophora seminiperda CCB06 TaxID=1302712 RepID=A0A3M7M978_9PLEO|nr:mitochondrion organization and biogenesis [Pyrenophora seminiperda CCB06]
MSGYNCSRTALDLFARPLTNIQPAFAARRTLIYAQPSRYLFDARRPRKLDQSSSRPEGTKPDTEIEDALSGVFPGKRERPAWAIQKEALKEKLGGEAWNPRKKLSPDTMEGIRHLNSTQPDKFTTPVLADHFKVSPEAIRRILKSNWKPSDKEYEERMERWNKRGERIWSNLVEMGVKPPKRWRDMGVGRARDGNLPRWKSRERNLVDVGDSVNSDFTDYPPDEEIIPTVGKSGNSKPITSSIPISERL